MFFSLWLKKLSKDLISKLKINLCKKNENYHFSAQERNRCFFPCVYFHAPVRLLALLTH